MDSNDTNLWHEILGHLNYKSLKTLLDTGAVHHLPNDEHLKVYIP